mgnify:CR=1 FL=1
MLKVRFKGNEYLLVGTPEEGALATEDQYTHGKCSYAHLFEDGRILRFREHIGDRADLEVIGEVGSPGMTDEAFVSVLLGEWTD